MAVKPPLTGVALGNHGRKLMPMRVCACSQITLDTNRLPPALNALFDDVLAMAPVAAEAVNGPALESFTLPSLPFR